MGMQYHQPELALGISQKVSQSRRASAGVITAP